MNCKPGDLAIVTKSSCGNEGRIVEVIRPLGVEPVFDGYLWDGGTCKGQFCWLCRSASGVLSTLQGREILEGPIPDSCLHPIRDPGDDATDESQSWLPPVPHKEIA